MVHWEYTREFTRGNLAEKCYLSCNLKTEQELGKGRGERKLSQRGGTRGEGTWEILEVIETLLGEASKKEAGQIGIG